MTLLIRPAEVLMPQAATKPSTTGASPPRREGSMGQGRLAVNPIPIERGASDEAASASKLQVSLLMGSGVVAAQIGKAIIAVPMIRSDLVLGLDLAGLIVATLGATTGIAAGLVVSRLG